ncbi:MAG: type I phosphomannose isomerase catalytic subunit [Acutalibacteraceae bacterium]|nr:type I phosphomannose isomerase catalytic subunit [Acutalibacteraceae bacterium]
MTAQNKYPLLLKPVIKDYLWGGTRLKTEFGFKTDKQIAAEGWMLACHKDGTNTVTNGAYAGKPLDEALKLFGYEEKFPILIKLIDAKDRLSVQVHPDNKYALENEGEYGKTEMWYVVDCEENAQLIYGFKEKISRSEFEERINNNTLDEVMNYVPVKKGDVFFIKSGTLHAIGKGILIAEIQQNSNTTYRVSDYGRLGADGKPRELHVSKAVDVTLTDVPDIPYGKVGEVKTFSFGSERQLADCEYFKTVKLDLDGTQEIDTKNAFVSLLVLSGEISVKYTDGEVKAEKGGCIFIPQGINVCVSGKAEIIKTYDKTLFCE